MEQDRVCVLFKNILDTINLILQDDFYTQKESLTDIKIKVLNWYDDYKQNSTLKNISVVELEYVDFEIIDLFDNYIVIESVKQNYVERLSYYFSILKKEWKNEMLGEK